MIHSAPLPPLTGLQVGPATAEQRPGLGHRVYFALVGSFGLWVGCWGVFQPTEIARAIPWLVPPLHARFIGAIYMAAAVMMIWSFFARHVQEVAIAVVISALWTGWLLLVSLLNLDQFDWARPPVWFWFFAYIAYPVMGARLAWLHRHIGPLAQARRVDPWVPGYFKVQGALLLVLAGCLFLAPAWMASLWPWKVSPLLAQIYSGPFLAYGIGSLLLARAPCDLNIRIVAASLLTFTVLALLASVLHRGLFTAGSMSASLWFMGLVLAALCLGVITARSLRPGALA